MMKAMSRTVALLVLIAVPVVSRTLNEVICGRLDCGNHDKGKHSTPSGEYIPSVRHLTSPSFEELNRWENYEELEPGTGLTPDTGRNPVPYGPGLGDVDVRTGVGVQHPFGGLEVRRDFGLFMGGSGRIGGQPVGWGNGYQRLNGAAPWFWP